MTHMEEVIACVERGWPVVPMHHPAAGRCSCGKPRCNSIGKHPRVKGGVHAATLDVPTAERWFKKWPQANVAIATGAASGVVVLDEDPRNSSEESIRALKKKYGELPDTVQCLSGSDGRHSYFAHPGVPIKNDGAGVMLGPGLDIRADGGLVVVPHSLHSSGRHYEWELSGHPGRDAGGAPAGLDAGTAAAPAEI